MINELKLNVLQIVGKWLSLLQVTEAGLGLGYLVKETGRERKRGGPRYPQPQVSPAEPGVGCWWEEIMLRSGLGRGSQLSLKAVRR